MANRNYQRGRGKEYEVKETLEGIGCDCTRSASSQGLWDVACVDATHTYLVQSKLTSTGDFSEDENCRLLREKTVAPNVKKELWLFAAGEGLIEVRDMKAPKPDARTPEGKTLRDQFRARATEVRAVQARVRAAKKLTRRSAA